MTECLRPVVSTDHRGELSGSSELSVHLHNLLGQCHIIGVVDRMRIARMRQWCTKVVQVDRRVAHAHVASATRPLEHLHELVGVDTVSTSLQVFAHRLGKVDGGTHNQEVAVSIANSIPES